MSQVVAHQGRRCAKIENETDHHCDPLILNKESLLVTQRLYKVTVKQPWLLYGSNKTLFAHLKGLESRQ